MDAKTIQEIIRLVNKSDLTEVEIEEKDFKIKIKRSPDAPVVYTAAPIEQTVTVAHTPVSLPPPKTETVASKSEKATLTPAIPANAVEFRSPMIGTFYRAPGPEKPNYVNVGDTVKKGQVLCIVEAMKLFNEIESEYDGKIVKILVENAQPVEYDQPLFLIELNA
jgi:acetyl-CoA carboxylase biotin carboxyl carrier protein